MSTHAPGPKNDPYLGIRIQMRARALILSAYPNLPKDGMSCLSALRKKDTAEYDRLYLEAKQREMQSISEGIKSPQFKGISFPLRRQSGRKIGDDRPPSERVVPGGVQNPKHEHIDLQKNLEIRVPSVVFEENTIDARYKALLGEVKADPDSGDFDQAIGKLSRAKVWGSAKELTFITDAPPSNDDDGRKSLDVLSLIGATWIHQTKESMKIYNEQWAGPDTLELVSEYNKVSA